MNSNIATAITMLEALPQITQEQVVEHLREHIASLQDEIKWNVQFQNTKAQLIAAARKAKQEIAAGKAEVLDINKL